MKMQNNLTIDYLIRTTWNSISKMYTEQATQYDSTMVMGFTLLSIDPKVGSLSMTLGPKMGIESTSLSRTLTKLEEEKMITRVGSKMDKRHVIIKLTKKGLKMRDISKANVLGFQNKVKEILSDKELKSLIKSLEKIQNLTQDINNEK
jgi:MarR family transcriptional regulator, organic hydroperoxide resistance regulator